MICEVLRVHGLDTMKLLTTRQPSAAKLLGVCSSFSDRTCRASLAATALFIPLTLNLLEADQLIATSTESAMGLTRRSWSWPGDRPGRAPAS
jgi:hypothetical protein